MQNDFVSASETSQTHYPNLDVKESQENRAQATNASKKTV